MKIVIKSWSTGNVLYACEAPSLRAAVEAAVAVGADLSSADLRWADLRSAELRSANLHGASLRGASLNSADLRGANLSSADLNSADLRGASLNSADLRGANLSSADLRGANLSSADLSSADLHWADLHGASLRGAVLPDGRTYEAYRQDPLAGICDDPEARARAEAAWGHHTWTDCPMHAAHGWSGIGDAPADRQRDVAAFVALFDARLLERAAQETT